MRAGLQSKYSAVILQTIFAHFKYLAGPKCLEHFEKRTPVPSVSLSPGWPAPFQTS